MNKFRQWYLNNDIQITWFIIGICTLSGLDALARGNYSGAAINFGIAFVNYLLNKK